MAHETHTRRRSALQALQEHFCPSIHYTHALCCHLYTILGLALLTKNLNKHWQERRGLAVALGGSFLMPGRDVHLLPWDVIDK